MSTLGINWLSYQTSMLMSVFLTSAVENINCQNPILTLLVIFPLIFQLTASFLHSCQSWLICFSPTSFQNMVEAYGQVIMPTKPSCFHHPSILPMVHTSSILVPQWKLTSCTGIATWYFACMVPARTHPVAISSWPWKSKSKSHRFTIFRIMPPCLSFWTPYSLSCNLTEKHGLWWQIC